MGPVLRVDIPWVLQGVSFLPGVDPEALVAHTKAFPLCSFPAPGSCVGKLWAFTEDDDVVGRALNWALGGRTSQ